MRIVELDGKKYRIRELTFGDFVEIWDRIEVTRVNPVTRLTETTYEIAKNAPFIISRCVEVEDGAGFRLLKEDEVKALPGRIGLVLLNACMETNDFLRSA